MLGTTVLIPTILVPQMGGGNDEKAKVIQTLLFVSGLNTLLQSLFGTRLPTVIGGSYTFVPPTISIILADRYNHIIDPHERFLRTMRGVQGALLAASSLQIIVGFSGLWRIAMRFLSPLSAVPLVTLSGLGLYHLGFPGVAKCIEIGLPEIVLLLVLTQYLPHALKGRRNIFDRLAVVLSVLIIWGYADILTVAGAYKHRPPKTKDNCCTNRSGLIHAAPWIKIPLPFQWGSPTFDAGEAFAMMVASFAGLIESTGTFIAVSRYASATPVPLPFSVVVLGGSENAGLLALTRVGSRRVIQISAGFMIFFSILGKFGAFFASIPFPIVAALYCIFFAYLASAGIGLLQFCNLDSFRTNFILGFSLFMGLSVPQYFKEYALISGHGPLNTRAKWFNDSVDVIFSSPATVAAMIAFFLDCTLHRADSATQRDRGWHWWEKFRSFKTDTRSEEFYSLPFNLNKHFPSV